MKQLLFSFLPALLLAHSAFSAALSIDGGLTWNGWNSVGQSNQLGVYGSGSTADLYEVYTTVFNFDNNSVTGSPLGGGPTGGPTGFGTGAFSAGAFSNGNMILGIGVRRVSGASLTNFVPTVRFDLDNDSFQAASSVGGADGRTSFTQWSEFRDFSIQFEGNATSDPWRAGTITMQAGNGTSNGGTDQQVQVVGGIGSGVSYDFPFRAFAQTNSYQMFFDLNATSAIYGTGNPNPFGQNANFTGIGTLPFASTLGISLNGLGSNNVALGVDLPAAIPEPGSAAMMLAAALAAAARYNRGRR
jgi:hypothetical protein